jgi:flagellar protein FliS
VIVDAYMENAIQSASPVELVRLMYEVALQSVGRARRCLREGDPEGRSREISRAHAIVTELAFALDHEVAPELGRNLAELYDYIGRRLLEAHTAQDEAPLEEVTRLLSTLLDGWMQVEQQMAAAA